MQEFHHFIERRWKDCYNGFDRDYMNDMGGYMNLLLSNDDGVFAAGIRALAQELKQYHNVAIVAPESQKSGASHSMTSVQPVRVRKVTLPELPDVPAFAVDGTPADCVRIGCTSLGLPVDMVVTGINHGANLGSDVLYSGTVGAAMEGAFLGKQSFAASTYPDNPVDFSAAARSALWTVDYIRRHPLPQGMILSVNAPELPVSEIRGMRLCGLKLQQYKNTHVEYEDPYGMRFFWAPIEKITECEPDEDTDERWVRDGYVTLTPIHFDIACYSYMKGMDVSDFDISVLGLNKKISENI